MSTFGFRGATSLPRGYNIICIISTVLSASLNMMSFSIHVTSVDLSKSFPQLESKSGSYNTPSKQLFIAPSEMDPPRVNFLRIYFVVVHPSSLLFLFFFWWHYLSSIIPVLWLAIQPGRIQATAQHPKKKVSLALQFFSFHVLQPSSNDKPNSPNLI